MGEVIHKLGLLLSLALCALLPLEGRAKDLGRPEGLKVAGGAVPRISWNPVPGAAVYRLAIFEAGGDSQGPLMAAVWVRGTAWTYGVDPVAAKIGGLPSTRPKALSVGRRMHVMVRAGDASGGRLGPWASLNFVFKPAKTPLLSASPSPPPGDSPQVLSAGATATPTPGLQSQDSDAELEIQGGAEFKSTNETKDPDLSGSAAAADDSASAQASASAPDSASPTASAADAAAQLKAGRYDAAQDDYKALLQGDPNNPDLWEGLGDTYKAQAMKVEAADCYEKALKFGSKNKSLQDWLDENVRN